MQELTIRTRGASHQEAWKQTLDAVNAVLENEPGSAVEIPSIRYQRK